MTQDPELVVIIILNLNKKEYTLKCLESVFKLDYYPYEVVLIETSFCARHAGSPQEFGQPPLSEEVGRLQHVKSLLQLRDELIQATQRAPDVAESLMNR